MKRPPSRRSMKQFELKLREQIAQAELDVKEKQQKLDGLRAVLVLAETPVAPVGDAT